MKIEKILEDYIKAENTDYAIMIDGEWGAGKSWFWNNILTPELEKISTPDSTTENPRYYKVVSISLFGISTPEELRSRIFEETSNFFKNKYVKTGAKLIGFGTNMLANYFSLGDVKGKEVTDLFSEFSIDLNHYILCFDDLERIKPTILLDLLGYINTLIEQDNAKVVFICNEQELKAKEYRKYKEKVVRFTHTIKANIGEMVLEFASHRKNNEAYSAYLKLQNKDIAFIYQKGDCSNLRTLKYNIDIFEKVFDTVRTTIQPYEEKHVTKICNYMLLLTIMYSIEYRKDNDVTKLRSLGSITSGWSYQIDMLDGLEGLSSNSNDNKNSDIDPIHEYQRSVRAKYFNNTYILGSSISIINYLLTGYLNIENLRKEITYIESESRKYETSEEKILFQRLSNFWDTSDEEMDYAVKRTLERVREASFILIDYPSFFLSLQRLQIYEFYNLGMSISELQGLFFEAIEKCEPKTYNANINGYFYNNEPIRTKEYDELVERVKQINSTLYRSNSLVQFETIVRNNLSTEPLNSFEGVLTNLFENIPAEEFLVCFVKFNNSRKRDFWKLFDERYNFRDCYNADKVFIDKFYIILKDYVHNPSTPINTTRKYCCKLIEMFDKKRALHNSELS